MKQAKLSELKDGDTVVPDSGFDCLPENAYIVKADEHGRLLLYCSEGVHYLDEQLEEDGDTVVGIYSGP